MSLEDFIDSLPNADYEIFRECRSGHSKAAQEKREQAAKTKEKIQAYKLAASSMEDIGFQVLSPLLLQCLKFPFFFRVMVLLAPWDGLT